MFACRETISIHVNYFKKRIIIFKYNNLMGNKTLLDLKDPKQVLLVTFKVELRVSSLILKFL